MTTEHDLGLEGVRPEPLGSYLKALAVLRLVAEQKDAQARGYWKDDVFHLVSSLDADGLLRFFADEYAPTPIVGPWGARSGFFGGASESAARAALEVIASTTNQRLAAFREVIARVRRLLQAKGLTEKAKDEDKIELLGDLRNALPDSALSWLDAAYVLGSRDQFGDLSRAFPPILGTGGNEGSQGYASTFMQGLVDVGIASESMRSARGALFGLPEAELGRSATGQYAPGQAGGFNQGAGFSAASAPMSSWEIVLLFEGAATWVSGPSTRSGARAVGTESSPFTVRQRALSGSALAKDEEKARAEIWAPLWSAPAHWSEISALLAEGRMHVGRRPARDTLEIARAAASLGVDRGIEQFVRYPVLVRNGKSYFAFSIGRFRAESRPEAELVGSLDAPLQTLDALLGREKNVPTRVLGVRRDVSEAIFELLRAQGNVRATALLRALGRLDRVVAKWSSGRKIAPLAGLSARWLLRAETTPELRLAAAIASIRARKGVGPFRANLVGVDAAKRWEWAQGSGQLAWSGASLARRLAGVVARRQRDAARERAPGSPFWSVVAVDSNDVMRFIHGEIDESLMEDLVHALTWIDWDSDEAARVTEELEWWRDDQQKHPLSRAYAMLKVCFWSGAVGRGPVVAEPSMVPLLLAGRVADACAVAQRRLRAHGLSVVDLAGSMDLLAGGRSAIDPVRLAGALLVRVSSLDTLVSAVTRPGNSQEEKQP